MADLIQIGVDVRTNVKQATADLDKMGGSVVNNINTINRLETEIKQLNKELDRGRITEAAYAKGMRQINNELSVFQQRAAKAAEVERKFGQTAAGGGKSLNRFNMTLQQGGYQLQDFVVQIQSGTSFFTAFSQQGSQFASIFGPKGAVIGAVIALGSAIGGIAARSLMASKSTKDFGEQLKETSSVMEEYISLASKSDQVFASLFESSKSALNQTSQAAKDLLLIAKAEALDSIRGLGKALADASTEAGFWAKIMLDTDRTVTGDLINIDTALRGNITSWKNTGKEVQVFIDTVRNIGEADSIDGMYQSALKARDIFKQNVDVTGEMTKDQKSFWKELSTTILNLEIMGATVEAGKQGWADTKEAVEAANASIKLFYENAAAAAEEQDKRNAAVERIKDSLAQTLLTESRRVEIAQAGANLAEVLAKHARDDFILSQKKQGILGNNLKIALDAYDNAVAALQLEADRNAELAQRGREEQALAEANAAYEAKADAANKAKTQAYDSQLRSLQESQIVNSAILRSKNDEMTVLEAQQLVQRNNLNNYIEQNKLSTEQARNLTAALDAVQQQERDLLLVKQNLANSKEEAKGLAKALDEAAKAMDKLTSFTGSLEGKISVARVQLDALNAGTDKRIAGEIELLRIKNAQLLNQKGLTGEALEAANIEYNKNEELIKTYEELAKAIDDKEDSLKRNTNTVEDNRTAYEKAMMTADEFAKALDQQVISAVDGVADAFSNFLQNGMKDFKSFVGSIKNMFIRLLADMAAMALKRQILIPITAGLAGGFGSAAAASTASGLVAGGGMAGTLAGAGTALSTGLSSGFMTTIYGGLSGAGGAISGGLAAGGIQGVATAIGAAIPVIAAVAVVVGLFSKKVKLLDSGLRTTVEGFDVAIETFKKTQTSRLFGLLKGSKKTEYEDATAEVADPLIEAVGDVQKSIMDAANTLGIGADAFENFSYQFQVSLKGLTEDEQLRKIEEEITKMGDAFASLTGHFETMNELLQVAQQRYDLETRLLQLQGNETELLIRQRELEVAATHELNQALLQQIYALEDAQRAVSEAQQATSSALEGLRNAISAEKQKIESSFQSIISGLTNRLNVANQAMNRSRNIYEMLSGALGSRTTKISSGSSESRASAVSYLRRGSFGDENKLSDALSVLSEPSEQLFGSFVDYARDFYQTSNVIADAAKTAKVQLSADERQILVLESQIKAAEANKNEQLEALDEQYRQMLEQYDALMGIDRSVKSVKSAIATLSAAIFQQAAAQRAQAAAMAAAAAAAAQAAAEAKARAAAEQAAQEAAASSARGYATGGFHSGGLRIVGERGPELEATGPSRIFSHNQTSGMFKDPELKDAVNSLRAEVAGLRSEQRQMQAANAKYIKRNYDINRKWDVDGLPATRT
jgi:hypothetical protein